MYIPCGQAGEVAARRSRGVLVPELLKGGLTIPTIGIAALSDVICPHEALQFVFFYSVK